MIETHGVRISVFGGMILTTAGLIFSILSLPTVAIFLIGMGMPFIMNTSTKVAATWFGPKGRNVAVMLFLIAYFVPQTLEEFLDEKTAKFETEMAISAGVITIVSILISKQP